MRRIALELGISANGASKMVARIHKRAGLPKHRVSVIRRVPPKPRAYWSRSEFWDELIESRFGMDRRDGATPIMLHEKVAKCCMGTE